MQYLCTFIITACTWKGDHVFNQNSDQWSHIARLLRENVKEKSVWLHDATGVRVSHAQLHIRNCSNIWNQASLQKGIGNTMTPQLQLVCFLRISATLAFTDNRPNILHNYVTELDKVHTSDISAWQDEHCYRNGNTGMCSHIISHW